MIDTMHLLICVINFLFVHSPAHLRRIPLRDISVGKNEEGNTLGFICTLNNNANVEEVQNVNDSLFLPYIQMMTKSQHNILRYNAAKLPSEPSLAKSFYLG